MCFINLHGGWMADQVWHLPADKSLDMQLVVSLPALGLWGHTMFLIFRISRTQIVKDQFLAGNIVSETHRNELKPDGLSCDTRRFVWRGPHKSAATAWSKEPNVQATARLSHNFQFLIVQSQFQNISIQQGCLRVWQPMGVKSFCNCQVCASLKRRKLHILRMKAEELYFNLDLWPF